MIVVAAQLRVVSFEMRGVSCCLRRNGDDDDRDEHEDEQQAKQIDNGPLTSRSGAIQRSHHCHLRRRPRQLRDESEFCA